MKICFISILISLRDQLLLFQPPVEVSFHKMRRRLKQKLPESRLSSVQVDQDFGEDQEEPRRIFFRVTSVKKTRSLKKDEEHLLKKPAIFFAYYPNEPYFYCDKPIFDQYLGEVGSWPKRVIPSFQVLKFPCLGLEWMLIQYRIRPFTVVWSSFG